MLTRSLSGRGRRMCHATQRHRAGGGRAPGPALCMSGQDGQAGAKNVGFSRCSEKESSERPPRVVRCGRSGWSVPHADAPLGWTWGGAQPRWWRPRRRVAAADQGSIHSILPIATIFDIKNGPGGPPWRMWPSCGHSVCVCLCVGVVAVAGWVEERGGGPQGNGITEPAVPAADPPWPPPLLLGVSVPVHPFPSVLFLPPSPSLSLARPPFFNAPSSYVVDKVVCILRRPGGGPGPSPARAGAGAGASLDALRSVPPA